MTVYNFYYLRDTVPNDINVIASTFDEAVIKFKKKTAPWSNVEICAVKIIIANLDSAVS